MARPSLRLAANLPGPFYVDSSCIDCGACWQWDPDHFAPTGGSSHVHRRAIGLALQACPVAAIGAPAELVRRTPADGFPALIIRHPAGEVHYCGWTSRRSFGASSYLVVRDGGNVLIDSPRFSAALARRIEALGGLKAIVLSHRDDVADHDRWAERFGCPRWIHAADADAAPGAEHRVEGEKEVALDADLRLLPTPGHTAGSMVALLGGQILFSGDHSGGASPLRPWWPHAGTAGGTGRASWPRWRSCGNWTCAGCCRGMAGAVPAATADR